jgi:hypothetical protein
MAFGLVAFLASMAGNEPTTQMVAYSCVFLATMLVSAGFLVRVYRLLRPETD